MKCKCGCGQEIIIKSHHKYYGIPDFIKGHNRIGKVGHWSGKHHSKESKIKTSKALMGIERSRETRDKMSKAQTGHFVSDETKKNMSISCKNRNHPSEFKSGKNHWNWKGGISPLYKQIKRLTEYSQWRSDVFQRDNWTCQTCGARSKAGNRIILNPHHIKAFAQIIKENNITDVIEAQLCKELWNINNGVTLCEECHKLTKNYGKSSKFKLQGYTR